MIILSLLCEATTGTPMPKEALQELADALATTRESAAMRELLEALLTPQERARLALRWRLVCLLVAGVHQRTIAQKLGISLCKITRGSRELKRCPVFRRKVAQYLSSRERTMIEESSRKGKNT